MNIDDAEYLIKQYGSKIRFIILKKVTIPEADILCCLYQGQRVNLKFDIVYGLNIEWLDNPNNSIFSLEILEFFSKHAPKKI